MEPARKESREVRCPFLKEEKVAFCRGYPIRKMIPFNRLYLKENLCLTEEYHRCPVYQERGEVRVSGERKVCPFLELVSVTYCDLYPVKKMIPASTFRLESLCTTENYIHCPICQKVISGNGPLGGGGGVRGFSFRGDLLYHPSHTWLKGEGERVRIGLDDFAQRLLGGIEGVVLPLEGEEVALGNPLLVLKGGGREVNLPSPLEGVILQRNREVEKRPRLINTDPYGRGWLVEMRPRGEGASSGYLSGAQAEEWLSKEVDRLHYILRTEIGVTVSDGGELGMDLRGALQPHQWELLIQVFLGGKIY